MLNVIKNYWLIIVILFISLVVVISLPLIKGKTVTIPFIPTPTPQVIQAPLAITLSYKGETGKDALVLLKKHAKIEQASSGLVVAINGRKANDKNHEYWAFYINGKLASVGPAEYQTKDTDKIMWKIETY